MVRRATSQHAKEIGARIVQARLELGGMSQKELADLLHVSQRSAQAYEAGEVIPYARLADLAEVLNVSDKWILHGDDGPESGAMLREMKRLVKTNTQILEELRSLSSKLDRPV